VCDANRVQVLVADVDRAGAGGLGDRELAGERGRDCSLRNGRPSQDRDEREDGRDVGEAAHGRPLAGTADAVVDEQRGAARPAAGTPASTLAPAACAAPRVAFFAATASVAAFRAWSPAAAAFFALPPVWFATSCLMSPRRSSLIDGLRRANQSAASAASASNA